MSPLTKRNLMWNKKILYLKGIFKCMLIQTVQIKDKCELKTKMSNYLSFFSALLSEL